MKAFSNEVVDRKMLSEVIKEYCNVSQVYHRFEINNNSNSNDKHKIVFELQTTRKHYVIIDDHYEIFDGLFKSLDKTIAFR
jgi:hypothetical protein